MKMWEVDFDGYKKKYFECRNMIRNWESHLTREQSQWINHLPQPWGQVYFGNNISNWGVKMLNLWKIINRKWKSLNCVQIFVNPWIVARQVPLSMEFSRQEHWGGLPFPSTRDLPGPRIEPRSLASQADSLPSEPLGKPQLTERQRKCFHR